MTLFHLHHDDVGSFAREERLPFLARAFHWFRAAFTTMHRAIVEAKMRRLDSEPAFHTGYRDDQFEEPFTRENFAKYPQRPLILGDKWDF